MSKTKIEVRRLSPEAILPTYAKQGDSGLDLHSVEKTVLEPGEVRAVGTGIAVAIPDGYEGQVRPRSGLSCLGIIAIPGTIDSGYRGEIKAILHNVDDCAYLVRQGDRIAQLVIAPVVKAELVEVDVLNETERGTDGFGSTGVRGGDEA